jgi:hypothetical protein
MNRFTLTITLTIISLCSFGQGGADIRYINITDIDENLLNRDVRIDFKSNRTTSSKRIADTVVLKLDNRNIVFIEKRKRGVDYWYYNDQYLESLDQGAKNIIKIFDSKIIDMKDGLWKFTITIESFEGDKKIKSETKNILIDPKDLDGVMIKV